MSSVAFAHEVIRASAGSGKTHQLTNRYLQLLASGIQPDVILATTFTRKAAGEILDRVLERLARACGDTVEAAALAGELGREDLEQADFLRLLRNVVRSLHRVRVGTLDSFYIALASSFSLEIGLPNGWAIGEEADDSDMRLEALESILEEYDAEILTSLYQRLTCGETKRDVQGELLNIVNALYQIRQETAPEVWKCLDVPRGLSPNELDDLLIQIEAFDLSHLTQMQKTRADDMRRARAAAWKDLLAVGLCKKVFENESTFNRKPIPADLIALYCSLIAHAKSELLQALAEQTWATREFLDGFGEVLWKLKQARGALRFDEVTDALVDAMQSESLAPELMAFRLDGAIEHLLLDEFQDTSLPQWRVLCPIAKSITATPLSPPEIGGEPDSLPVHGERRGGVKPPHQSNPRSFFCVGDIKQAIYLWRGGMAAIFNTLQTMLENLEERPLDESRRSAQPIIDVVNRVFSKLPQVKVSDKCRPGLAAWTKCFQEHTTVHKAKPGYVCLHTGPAQQSEQSVGDQRNAHYTFAAQKVRELVRRLPGRSIGILCRTNDTVARMIYELRQVHVEASEEGGKQLTDSPAVELILSLFTLADHPGHSVAWFHLKNSRLREPLEPFADADSLSAALRGQILQDGYGKFTHSWASKIAPHCDRRDLSRLQQLVEMAYDFEARSTLRADDFVAWVRTQRVPDPSSADVRVMTIHGAKGLQFDAVVLPELEAPLLGMPPLFVVDRNPKSLEVNFVCRYANENTQLLLAEHQRRAFESDRQLRVEESLSMLYVAMTRAIHALYMFVPGPRERGGRQDVWYKLLQQTLAAPEPVAACAPLFEHGDAEWYKHIDQLPPIAAAHGTAQPERITFRAVETGRRRGLRHVAPSQREGHGRVDLDKLFHPSQGTGTAAGTLYHAWFEAIRWLDDGPPTDAALRQIAQKLRAKLPAETWLDLDRLLANFRGWLVKPAIRDVLCRSAYANPQQWGFPAALAPLWKSTIRPLQVERERRFLIPGETTFWNGSLDRIVWLGDGDRIVAADVLDFKTDDIPAGDAKALADRTGHYRPQLEAYREAVAKLARLPVECVATRLVFTGPGQVVNVERT